MQVLERAETADTIHPGASASSEAQAHEIEQASRMRKLFSAIVIAAMDEAIVDGRKGYDGVAQIARWARSADGKQTLSCAGIVPDEATVKGMMEFVANDVRPSIALADTNS